MDHWQLYKALRLHRKLAERRSFDFDKNKAAKWIVIFGACSACLYLLGFAVLLSWTVNGDRTITSLEFICGILPFVLFADFSLRFVAQQTPSLMVKPYVLLPIPKFFCIDVFIFRSLFNWGNLTWFILFVPYCVMSVVFSFGLATTLLLLLFFYICILADSQWYLIVRTLVSKSLLWWLLPAAIYCLIAAPALLGSSVDLERLFNLWCNIGNAFQQGYATLPLLAAFLLLVALLAVNRRLQYRSIYNELSKQETAKLRTVSHLAFFDRFGQVGQFLKLEIKTILRNKTPKRSFMMTTAVVVFFTLMICYTDIYGDASSATFWCIYNYAIYGVLLLVKVMGNEGNYIDLLMVHRQNILNLLHAKYIFCSTILLLPFLLMLPTVLVGKWPLTMVVSYAVFTAGFQYFLLFQLAVYNRTTSSLNEKFISKNGVDNSYWQLFIEMVAFFLPVVMISFLRLIFSSTVTFVVIGLVGLAFIVTEPLWMTNIYRRMMARKYINLEAFRATRPS